MKVLMNAISAKKGGIVTYTTNLAKDLPERGVDVTIVVPQSFNAPDASRVMRVEASDYTPSKRLIWEQTAWRQIVKKFKPDVLFSSANFGLLSSPCPQILLLREGGLFDPFYMANMALEQGLRTAALRYWRRKMMLMSAERADFVMTPSQAMKDLVLHWKPEMAEQVQVNSYGALSDAFTPQMNLRKWREGDELKLLYVSVYYPHKNPSVVVEAVRALREKGIRASATITMDLSEILSMPGGDADYRILEQGEAEGLVRLGRHPYSELPNLYASHDIFVFPSVSETFGHPMAEAMSCSRPIIAADTDINREICGEAALYFTPFHWSDLTAKVLELDANPALRKKQGEVGRERAVTRFLWPQHVDRLVEIFHKVKEKNG